MKNYDVVIVGAGPAGVGISSMLKDIGIEKTLVRKSIFIMPQDQDVKEPRDLVLFDKVDEPIMREDIVSLY